MKLIFLPGLCVFIGGRETETPTYGLRSGVTCICTRSVPRTTTSG